MTNRSKSINRYSIKCLTNPIFFIWFIDRPINQFVFLLWSAISIKILETILFTFVIYTRTSAPASFAHALVRLISLSLSIITSTFVILLKPSLTNIYGFALSRCRARSSSTGLAPVFGLTSSHSHTIAHFHRRQLSCLFVISIETLIKSKANPDLISID